jgi:ClpP class serine protease
MTTQATPPTDAERAEHWRIAYQGAEAKAAHWQAVADKQRGQIDALSAENDRLRAMSVLLSNDAQHAAYERDQANAYTDARLAQLLGPARAVVGSAARELNYTAEVRLVSTAALGALRKVSEG